MDPADRVRLEEAIAHILGRGADGQLEASVVLPDEPRRRHYLFTLVGLRGPEGDGTGGDGTDGLLVSITDVTDSVALREQLRRQATSDPLTGCLNRNAVLAALEADLGGSHAAGLAVSLDPGQPPLPRRAGKPTRTPAPAAT